MNFYDPCSFSNPGYFIITHISFNWNVDFDARTINGFCDIKFKKNEENSDAISLDTRALTIKSVVDLKSNKNLPFELGSEHKAFGQSLKISTENIINDEFVIIRFDYETSPQSTALQWLDANMTLGRRLPYLFSQCQAIHARSLFPCQDTPAVKFTYDAKVKVNKGFVALMSATREEPNYIELNDNLIQYGFKQNIKIPSYLLAIAVGDLVSKRIGPRSHVWTEKELIDEAAEEFSEIEEMLQKGESIAGPYIWGNYDLLVLPPTFPYGGMENPLITFVTPTLIAGDKSLADVVIHEISHSWTGNLITNRNWEHFWLNEGFTMFLQRKIMSRMRGESHRQFDCIEGWRKMREAVNDFGEDNQLTKLIPNLTDVDPDDSFSSIPYEKGHMLLYLLETKLGGIEVFDKYLRAHIERFNSLSFDSNDWKTFLYEYFHDKHDILDSINWNGWLNTSGMPPDHLEYVSKLLI
jgi:leukotriene-A4 hydrolase